MIAGQRRNTTMTLRTLLPFAFALAGNALFAQAPNTIWSYAVGDWRNGPVVKISPLFETTEAFTTPQLIAHVKKVYPAFAQVTDIDIQRFATVEEGELSRTTLRGKYLARKDAKLEVDMLEGQPAVPTALPAVPETK